MESWRPIPGWPGYEASDLGRVRSLDRVIETLAGPKRYRGKVIKSFPNTHSERAQVRLSEAGRQSTLYVSSLVLAAFVGPRPSPKHDACHNDGNHRDNRLGNLRWDTRSENMLDVIRHGRHNHAGKTHCKQGHPFDQRNTHLLAGGRRACRRCSANAQMRYRKRRTAEAAAT